MSEDLSKNNLYNEQEINYLLEYDNAATAAERLRLTMGLLNKYSLPATPLNYVLFYIYVSGKNTNLNERIDDLIEQNNFSHEEAVTLFIRFFFHCGDAMLDSLRSEFLSTITEVIGTLVDIAGKSSLTNKQLDQHIDALVKSQTTRDILSVLSLIISETRQFVSNSKQLEIELLTSSKGLKQLKNELVHARIEATTDALTGLYNRRGFDEQLKKLMNDRRRNGNGFSVIMADLDHFKDINDNHGHLVGDKVLRAFAKLLDNKTRETDFAARFGGEEFILLLPNTSLDNAYIVAENIRKAIEKMKVKQTKSGLVISSITASFGIAVHRFDETAHDLLDRCDKAMYKAKHLGRNRSFKSQ